MPPGWVVGLVVVMLRLVEQRVHRGTVAGVQQQMLAPGRPWRDCIVVDNNTLAVAPPSDIAEDKSLAVVGMYLVGTAERVWLVLESVTTVSLLILGMTQCVNEDEGVVLARSHDR